MKFCDKLLQLRRARRLTQKEVAAACGITRQTYSGYESGERYPKKKETYRVLADFFAVKVDYLYTDSEAFIGEAGSQYGRRGMAQAKELVGQLAGMFAGGELSDEDRDAVMRSLERAYWLAKEDNQKYTPKKYRK
ncbi:helix-turn-helix domain-containing protein [Mitsuokella sp.]|uniref:helix-turn-helix domain-containing protein n=1 Tax=unclassified Mitsuokella TaxID=2637239 RepID=UPI003D7C5F28